ncbi:flavin reductase family protein [Burkholderia oklahomensis]|uniref:Flavin reductase like domain protein n=1 Tax=Burkholderia oklahomensis TaxID=342113 RepID=A0AAI8FRL7_9BURK|nr:flavin reductase family protein [Burkholderia oklahomensis]AIO70077.1 flavin reductase like domain protein [Burkholderia oklahomensis]AOI40296.1 flavin reductase [Burkholderia oklahomensis EO147]KUY65178.1 flavin reductase [Burkholderia oklahomensis EO147]QPS39338.1 flavin reductase family protein [Burkholderia oklahomensis]
MSNTVEIAQQLKQAMRGVAATVTIVTTGGDGPAGAPCAMTASSFTSMSLDPPTVLVCINKRASIHASITDRRRFCVNALQSCHAPLALACSVSGSDTRFAHGAWRIDAATGLPYLENAQTSFFCDTLEQFEVGSHSILVGKVTRLAMSDDINPLMYVNGTFAAVRALPPDAARAPSHAGAGG